MNLAATTPASSPATASRGGGRLGPEALPAGPAILLLWTAGGATAPASTCSRMSCNAVDRIGIAIRVAHYPPYTSESNPIERRLFPHMTRACQGVMFDSVALVKGLMEKPKTSPGLRVTVEVLDKVCQTGRKYAKGFKEAMEILFDEILPKWNYRVVPSGS